MTKRTVILTATVLLSWLALPAASTNAQPQLYSSVLKSRGYVVGSPLSESGLHRYEGDTTWTHMGWNAPRIAGLAAAPDDERLLFLASGNGVIWTPDGGRYWRLATGWEVTESQDVAVDPNAPDDVYVATGFGVWRSNDRGWTWIESNDGIAETYTNTIEVDHARQRRLLVGSWGGIYESNDGARSWALVSSDDVSIMDLEQSRADPQFWAAATRQRGVLLSRDGGKSWQSGGAAVDDVSVMSVATDPTDASRVAAAGWDTGVLVSTDGGATWTRRGDGLPVQDFYQVVFDPGSPGSLWVATVEHGIFRSDDLGATWDYRGLNGTLVFDLKFLDWRAE